MKAVDQKYLHIPGKQNGDCWRACLASILECEIDDFPYESGLDTNYAWSIYHNLVCRVLEQKGWHWMGYEIHNIDLGLLDSKDTDGHIIAVGKSPRGEFSHAIVWKNGIAHDPHPDKTGINNITYFEVLTKTLKP